MDLSLNELASLVKQASMGAGQPWGVAEEAGYAVKWLAARGQPGAAAIASVLESDSGGNPLTVGAMLSDDPDAVAAGFNETVAMPLLLAPFCAGIAGDLETAISIAWADGRLVTDGPDLWLEGTPPDVADIAVSATSVPEEPALMCTSRADVPADVFARLTRLAERMLAPATEESRRLGAGSSESDND
ncbi:MAG: DUF3726 domain-containing protein [Pseudomonadota bacterium]